MEWRLHAEDSGRIDLLAILDETRHISGAGDRVAPLVQLHFNWERYVNTARVDASRDVIAVSVSLFPKHEHMFSPWVQTGLIPRRSNARFSLPLTHPMIEVLTEQAARNPDHSVRLTIGLQVLARSPEGDLVVYVPSGSESVEIGPIEWRRFLVTWGYPATKFIEVPSDLPALLETACADAACKWRVCVSALSEAHRKWIGQDEQGAGGELRRAVQFALGTWDAIWFPGQAATEDSWTDCAARIADGIPGLRNYTIPPRSEPDVQRVFSRLQLLRNLNTMANAFHHVGEVPVYTRGDVDTLLTAITAVLRGLPDFFLQYPKALSTETPESL